MAQCVNCCVPMSSKQKVMGVKILKKVSSSTAPVLEEVSVSSVLNYIFRVSGRTMTLIGDTGPNSLCQPCWTIVFDLYTLHKKLAALTQLGSLINSTFHVLDEIIPPVVIQQKSKASPMKMKQKPSTQTLNPIIVHTRTMSTAQEKSESLSNTDTNLQQNSDVSLLTDSLSSPEVVDIDSEEEDIEMYDVDCDDGGSCNANATHEDDSRIEYEVPSSSTLSLPLLYNGNCSEVNCSHIFRRSTKIEVVEHIEQVHGRKLDIILKCHICGMLLKNPITENLDHFKTHPVNQETVLKISQDYNDGYFKTKCGLMLRKAVGETLIEKRRLDQFRRKKKRLELNFPKPCPHCQRIFKYPNTLNRHIKVVHDKKFGRTCPVCERPMSTKAGLMIHLETHKNPEERAKEKARRTLEESHKPKLEFLCQECGKTFNKMNLLTSHSKTHLPKKNGKIFTCSEPDCNFSALTKKILDLHLVAMHEYYYSD